MFRPTRGSTRVGIVVALCIGNLIAAAAIVSDLAAERGRRRRPPVTIQIACTRDCHCLGSVCSSLGDKNACTMQSECQ